MADPSVAVSRGRSVFSVVGFVFALGLAAISVVGLFGRWNAWADVVNQFAPIWLCIAAAALLVMAAAGRWRQAPWSSALILLAVAAQTILVGPDLADGAQQASFGARRAGAAPFSVLTFNVWNEATDRSRAIDRIVSSGADVVTLQEALGLERMSSAELTAAYPYRATCDDWWGCEILILSKRPILEHHYAAPEPTGSGGPLWAVWITTTASDGRSVAVLSTHFAWPVPPDFRRGQVKRLGDIVRGLGGRSLIVTGDCNADGSSFALRGQDSELPGLIRRTHGTLSWPAIIDGTDWPAPFPFLAIDQVYASRDWRTLTVTRLPRSGSDHYPILVRLARREGAG